MPRLLDDDSRAGGGSAMVVGMCKKQVLRKSHMIEHDKIIKSYKCGYLYNIDAQVDMQTDFITGCLKAW